MEKGYKYLGVVLLLTLLPITIIGFYKTYLGQFPSFVEDPGSAVHFHFIMAALWILMHIIQPLLIKIKKIHYHRLIGKASYLFFVLLLISFIPLIIKQLQYDYLPLTVLTFSDVVAVSLFYFLGVYHKSDAQIHMRYMIVLAIVFAMPAVGRIFAHWLEFEFMGNMYLGFAVKSILLLSLIIKDKLNNKNYKPYVVGLLFFIVVHLAISVTYYSLI